jgi:hypothetical protein
MNPPDSCVFRSCGVFSQESQFLFAVTFLEPPKESFLYGTYVGSYAGIKK